MIVDHLKPTGLTSLARPSIWIVAACIPFLALAAGYRWFGPGLDYGAYLAFFERLSQNHPLTNNRFEIGFTLLAWVFKFVLGTSYDSYAAVLVLISLSLKFRLIVKHTSSPVLASFCYLLMLYPVQDYTQTRAAVGLAFAFTAIDCLKDSRMALAILCAGVGTIFHYTAVIPVIAAIGILFTSKNTFILPLLLISAGAAAIGVLLHDYIDLLNAVNASSGHDIDHEARSGFNSHILQEAAIGGIMVMSWFTQKPQRSRDAMLFLCLSFCSIAALLAFGITTIFAIRISELFLLSIFFYAFRFNETHESRIPAYMILVNGIAVFQIALARTLITF